MIDSNMTKMRGFVILGFPGLPPQYYGPVSAVFFFIYLMIILGNIFILAFVMYEKSLQKPTYLVFCHLALCDLSFGTLTLPRALAKYWFGQSYISFYGCLTQMFFVHFLGSVQSFILLVMAVDRFVAVCFPLRYPTVITNRSISALCGFAWFIPFLVMIGVLCQTLKLIFCKSNLIYQWYCDYISVMDQACGENVQRYAVSGFIVAMFCLLVPLGFILFSYVAIITVIVKMSSTAGRKKTLSTCTPQILITCLFYLPRLFVYVIGIFRFSYNVDIRLLLILLYSLLPPTINPVIYCFKTKDIKEAIMTRLKNANISVKVKLMSGIIPQK